MGGSGGGQCIGHVVGTEQVELDPRHAQRAVQVERRATTLVVSNAAGVEIRAGVVQGEGQHRAIAGALFPDGEGLVIKVQYRHAILTQTFEDLALGFDNLLWPAELADMSGSGIVDQRYLRLGQADGIGDFTDARGTQLDDRRGMLRGQFEQGQRCAEIIVEVAASGQHRATGTQNARKHFLDRGLAAGTGDGGNRLVECGAVQRAQLAQGQAGVANHQLRQAAARHFALHQGGDRALGGNVVQVVVTVEARPGQGDKQLPGSDCPAVDADAIEGRVLALQAAVERRGQLAEGQWLKHRGPPTRQGLSRLRPGRRSRGARR
ncbi:hypothetical protein D3C80_1004530 [compost metagenome]